ncbi:hypothetical protein [Sphingobacterium multivorum]|uniref:hypothetical protein n=1 Tax=Sphingobacterium multivorum TaxID=28454 RepID=UPI0028B1E1FC|nr:hypothetical protein [Sphingobacterium multivorum]
MKLIIIDHEPFSFRKEEHYFIEQFLNDGIEVEYWDVSKALKYSCNVVYQETLERSYVKVFTRAEDVVYSIDCLDNKDAILVLEIYLTFDSLKIFQTISKNSIKWSKINYYHNPTNYLNTTVPTLDKFSKLFNFKRVLKKVQSIYLKQYQSLTIPEITFLTGSEKSVSSKQIISIDFFDIQVYDNLSGESEPLVDKAPYIVFLDIMFSNHPDFQRNGVATVSSEKYFDKMRGFFDFLEKESGKQVVIASHPRANYKSEYGNRIIIKNKTCELVKYADLVLTHGSLSISYALLAKKPILYLYFNEMLETADMRFYYLRMLKAKSELGAEIKNIDDKDLSLQIPAVDNKKYNDFLSKVYLKSGGDLRSNYEIIKESLIDLLKTG